MREDELLGSIEFVGGPLDGQVRWGSVSSERLALPMQQGGFAVYKPTGAIKTNGNCEFKYAGVIPRQ